MELLVGSMLCATACAAPDDDRRDVSEPMRMIEELESLPVVMLPASLGEVLNATAYFERVPYGGRAREGAVEVVLSAENKENSGPSSLDTPIAFLSATWSVADDSSAAEKWRELLTLLTDSLVAQPICESKRDAGELRVKFARFPWREGGVDLWLVHSRSLPGRTVPMGVEPAEVRIFVWVGDWQPPARAGSTPEICS